MERQWEISDLDGSKKRMVTLAQYRAELDKGKAKALRLAEIRKAMSAALHAKPQNIGEYHRLGAEHRRILREE